MSAGAAKQHRGGGRHTVERLNLRKKLLPALVLLVHAAEVGDVERLLRIGFPVGAQVESVHNPISEVDVRMTAMKRRQSSDGDFVIVVTVRVLERVSSSSIVRVYNRRKESVYESIGKVLFAVRARVRGGEGRRARDGVIVKVYRRGCREDFELRHSSFVGRGRTGLF